jgi:hypothetical protein
MIILEQVPVKRRACATTGIPAIMQLPKSAPEFLCPVHIWVFQLVAAKLVDCIAPAVLDTVQGMADIRTTTLQFAVGIKKFQMGGAVSLK